MKYLREQNAIHFTFSLDARSGRKKDCALIIAYNEFCGRRFLVYFG